MVHTAMWPVGAILPRDPGLSVGGDRKEDGESFGYLALFCHSPSSKRKDLKVFIIQNHPVPSCQSQ